MPNCDCESESTTPFLDSVALPEDLRRLPIESLPAVATEARAELVRLGAASGGHFAGSLGACELTIALHWVYETPSDRVVWDVGHQAYVHKMLTGRRRELERIKRADGPSGFLRRAESVYDVFGAGHAGTSVSAAVGVAQAIRARGGDDRVVAVLGDGAATAGMSFEALNHAGELGVDVGVVLNDNGMSIAPSVGGLSRTGRWRDYLESLGATFVGCVDGHDFDELAPALLRLRESAGLAVLHVRTRKGAGYGPAESDPYGWHATRPFDVASGLPHSSAPTARSWTSAFSDALIRLAEQDERVVAITAAMPDGTGLDRFAERFPGRTFDVGIAEQHAVTFAAGLAAEGLRPVCAIYSTFLQRGFDQIVHDVAMQNLPVTFALDRAGLVGGDGPTHHGLLDLSYLRIIPGLAVAAPRDEKELFDLLRLAVESGQPFALRYPRGALAGELPAEGAAGFAEAQVLRDGSSVTLLAIGKTVATALEVADRLAERGVSAGVVDARFIKPLDTVLIAREAKRTGCLVTLEDHTRCGGFGGAVLEQMAGQLPRIEICCIGVGDSFVPHGDVADQWRAEGMDASSVTEQVEQLLGKKRAEVAA